MFISQENGVGVLEALKMALRDSPFNFVITIALICAIVSGCNSKSTGTEIDTQDTKSHQGEVLTYIVKTGDTVFSIAEKFHLKPSTILWANDFLDDDLSRIAPGIELYILPTDGIYYEWKEGDNLIEVAKYYGVEPKDILSWPGNHLDAKDLHPKIKAGSRLVIPGGQMPFYKFTPVYPSELETAGDPD